MNKIEAIKLSKKIIEHAHKYHIPLKKKRKKRSVKR